MEGPSSACSRMESIIALLDKDLIDFLNTRARKLITRSTWDSLPLSLRVDLEQRSMDELRRYAWCMDEDDGKDVVPLREGDLLNVGRAVRRFGIPKESREPLAVHELCPAAKIGMTPKASLGHVFVLG